MFLTIIIRYNKICMYDVLRRTKWLVNIKYLNIFYIDINTYNKRDKKKNKLIGTYLGINIKYYQKPKGNYFNICIHILYAILF